ncbi:MAG: type III-B CRISPR-associated protein Cas10/Cmr2 [Methanomicrobiales archaeon]|nr:type III-B CRISPR-associated protein Cas10/Cmr2 [Methanomicrobiales archaeon]MDI6876072.1 type III-B CRISPR-associated protein Cas10/Cmr2 [Methanomicrobiales archaeon]
MTDAKRLQFSLGPVQGFIAQGRRTRDLWSGSYLLSYLSGCAMAGVRRGGGRISVPDVRKDLRKDLLLQWIAAGGDGPGEPPRIGTLPNKFEAEIPDTVSVEDAAKMAVDGINTAWNRIALTVWDRYLGRIAEECGKGTEEIWNRQVRNFWEISWIAGDSGDMEARKNWRIYRNRERYTPTIEGGDHCTIMSEWQELSGFMRAWERQKQDRFWKRVRENIPGMVLREDERLCAIAFIKRLFPEVSKEAIGWDVNAERWPSTTYMAAIPWLKRGVQECADLAKAFAENALLKGQRAEREGLAEQFFEKAAKEHLFLNLDANYYYKETLSLPRRTPLEGTSREGEEPETVKRERKDLLGQLARICEALGTGPSPFYAMLAMDGDRIGELIERHTDRTSRATTEFSSEVGEIVRSYSGALVYAGGDDLLAMLPLRDALQCACHLHTRFSQCFEKVQIGEATVSAALVFAHYQVPLSSVLEEVRELLDGVAKERNGRNSLAISVVKNSGKYCEWVQVWDGVAKKNGIRDEILLESLADDFRQRNELSASFFFRMRDLIVSLVTDARWSPGQILPLWESISGKELKDLIVSEYIDAGEHRRENDTQKHDELLMRASRQMERLLAVSRRHRNGEAPETTTLSMDGLLLVKFLSTEGVRE